MPTSDTQAGIRALKGPLMVYAGASVVLLAGALVWFLRFRTKWPDRRAREDHQVAGVALLCLWVSLTVALLLGFMPVKGKNIEYPAQVR